MENRLNSDYDKSVYISVNAASPEDFEYFHEMIECVPAFICSFLPDGTIKHCNEAFARMTGISKEELTRKKFFSLLYSSDLETIKDNLKILTPENHTSIHIQSQTIANGKTVYQEWRNRAFFDAKGKAVHYIAVGIDVSENRRTALTFRESEERYRLLFDSSPVGIGITDMEGNAVAMNKVMMEITGFTLEDIKSKSVLSLYLNPEAREEMKKVLLEKGEVKDWEVELKKLNGERFTALLNVNLIETSGNKYLMPSIRDITEIKNTQKVLLKANRTNAFISEINQLIVRAESMDELFSKSCQIAVETGKFRMSWIGIINESTGFLEPHSVAGVDDGYLSSIKKITIDGNFPEGQGPLGTAVREKRAVYSENIATSQIMAPWRDEALKRGYNSAIALPIRLFGKVIGAYTIYSETVDFFDKEEVNLLENVTANISFALEKIQNHKVLKYAIDEIKESEYMLQEAQSIGNTGSWTYEAKTNTVKWSANTFRIFDADPDDEENFQFPNFIDRYVHPDDREYAKEEFMKSAKDDKRRFYIEYRIIKHDGEIRTIHGVLKSFLDSEGNLLRVVGWVQDITRQKLIEQELIQAKKKAEEMSELKSNFLANMSHELRTPMVAILGFSELLHESLEEPDTKGFAYMIFEGGKRLTNTLNLILDLSRIESCKTEINIVDVNISDAARSTVELFKKQAEKNNLKIVSNLDESAAAEIDTTILEKIIQHLLENAIKFTDKGHITVTTGKDEINGVNHVFLRIEDTGIGIPEDMLKIIFEPFRQASEGRSRKFEGTGLGLAICKKYVELMEGTIEVKSKVGKGTAFTVRFLSSGSKRPAETNTFTNQDKSMEKETVILNKEKRILVVEDEALNINLIKQILKNSCQYDCVSSGEEAIKIVKEKKFSLILMDIGLKGIDGIQTLIEIRKIEDCKNIPAIAITAYAMKGDKSEFLKTGFTDYLSKPFNISAFKSLINEYLK
ncbi:MAG: PAS domain S-box protein [Candidatus Kapaibacterium sp.]